MQLEISRQRGNANSPVAPVSGSPYAWKERTYVVPMPSRTGFQWKASALHGLQRLDRRSQHRRPVTVVVPALYNVMPAEVLALGWLNEIDSLATIRQRMIHVAKLLGWDVFTFHTRHSLDPFFDSAIKAVRETWLNEGALNSDAMSQTRKRFGAAYDYHSIEPRLVENLLIQSSLMDWMTVHSAGKPFEFHVIGTGLLSALTWSGALSFQSTVRTAVDIGLSWDTSLKKLAKNEIHRTGLAVTDENLGWLRFHRVRQMIEERSSVSLAAERADLPGLEDPHRPFWFSSTAKSEPVRVETRKDVRAAMETLNLASWSPDIPQAPKTDQALSPVRGWLVSPMHPIASACHWSFHNYLLATPAASQLFLNHIASAGPDAPVPLPRNVFNDSSAATYRSARTSETRSAPAR